MSASLDTLWTPYEYESYPVQGQGQQVGAVITALHSCIHSFIHALTDLRTFLSPLTPSLSIPPFIYTLTSIPPLTKSPPLLHLSSSTSPHSDFYRIGGPSSLLLLTLTHLPSLTRLLTPSPPFSFSPSPSHSHTLTVNPKPSLNHFLTLLHFRPLCH